MKRPTNRMQQYLEAIREFIYKNGYSPTIRELRDKLNVTSTATIQNMLMRMREKGLIDFEDYKQRTIRILDNKKIIATKEELIKMGYYQVIEEKNIEIEQVNNMNKILMEILKEKDEKIDKVIEYIEKDLSNLNIQENIVAKNELLQIKNMLKGEDK